MSATELVDYNNMKREINSSLLKIDDPSEWVM